MARARTAFFCTDCGNESARWVGRCPACGAWNTLVEEPVGRARKDRSPARRDGGVARPLRLAEVDAAGSARLASGIAELDFVLGGGLVPGSLVLLGGEPGIGKSTLLLQVAARIEGAGRPVLYVSGEESAAQVRMRAERVGGTAGSVSFLGETDVERILSHADEARPALLVVDSIQTAHVPDMEAAPGTVGQVRECAARLQRFAKAREVAVVVVGHVTKGGSVAGPRTLEHIVDVVLYFESARGIDHRILRATKNRFGGAGEIGVFRMTAAGLEGVANPSEMLLRDRPRGVSGSAILPTIEGTRPLLVEVQALCAKSSYGAPQRVSTGFGRQRLALLLAVLEKRGGIPFGALDVFLNVVGGVRLREPAGDLAVVVALASSAVDRPAPPDAIFLGEVGLGGELRAAPQAERRLAEAARLGFECAYLACGGAPERVPPELRIVEVAGVGKLVERVLA